MEAAKQTPWHLWAVGIVSLIWNAIGGYDYIMTRTKNMDYLEPMGFDDAAMAYIDGFPLWANIAWGLGVWGAIAGSILLLLKSRHAVIAFALSLAGAFLSNLYPRISEPPAAMQGTGATIFALVILAIAIALLWYARRQAAAGVLR